MAPKGDPFRTTPHDVTGSAAPVSTPSSPPVMVTDGRCITETVSALEAGSTGQPLPPEVVDASRAQAQELIESVLAAYAKDVAVGEVGQGGNARASTGRFNEDRCPTGLLYGRVQSGKTLAMILSSALAIDNDFRVIVVFTSNFVKLVEQTADRFEALQGPLVRASTSRDEWDSDREHIRKNIGDHGLVLVCAKDPNHIEHLVEFLKEIGAPDYPALIFDDEADQATPDTQTRKRSQARDDEIVDPSRIHQQIVAAEASAFQTLRHSVFVQVTATPFPLLLQHTDSPLRPRFTRLLEPGAGYTGGESFFSAAHVEEASPPLRFVAEQESEDIDADPETAPRGLAEAISFFLLSAAAQRELDPASRARSQNFLCHTSPRKGEHEKLHRLIRDYLGDVESLLEGNARHEVEVRLEWAYEELGKSLPNCPTKEALLATVKNRLHLRRLYVVNSANSRVDFGKSTNFIIGGNILGRGLTIENLLVTYYLRRARISQMDTMLQHARMFGYRRNLMPFTRVFLPESLAIRFHQIYAAESSLRQLIRESEHLPRIPVAVAGTGLRVTRPSVLDTSSIGVIRAGEHLYPSFPVYRRVDLGDSTEAITRLIDEAFGGPHREGEFLEVPISTLVRIASNVRISDEDSTRWDAKAIEAILSSIAEAHKGQGFLFVRRMRRTRNTLPTGALSGAELAQARARSGPVLCMFQETGDAECWDHASFWYPSIVFPRTMPNQVFNLSD